MKNMSVLLLFGFLLCVLPGRVEAQNEETEKIEYYQLEPYNDSLFVKIQEEVSIDPPDPKAEIIVDIRDPNNQTVSIKGALYPFLAFSPETRAKILTFPFKINLLDDINYGSVFTRVIEKIKFSRIIEPPRRNQIISSLFYINPYLQVYGGERFGIPFKEDIGVSMGFGTPYSFPMETNFVDANIHILGFYGGGFGVLEGLVPAKYLRNPLLAGVGYQVGYVVPFGNFFEASYQRVVVDPTKEYLTEAQGTRLSPTKYMSGSYYNWEFRYPLRVLGASRAKLYFARYQRELHAGFTGRELSLAGSTFDFRFDALFNS
ncbi:MAG: hypothetical protein ACM3RX_08635, partial [Methanococcaceae archaeon]